MAEINALESGSKDEDVVRALNVILVDLGEIDTFSAMIRMDDFDDDFDEEE